MVEQRRKTDYERTKSSVWYLINSSCHAAPSMSGDKERNSCQMSCDAKDDVIRVIMWVEMRHDTRCDAIRDVKSQCNQQCVQVCRTNPCGVCRVVCTRVGRGEWTLAQKKVAPVLRGRKEEKGTQEINEIREGRQGVVNTNSNLSKYRQTSNLSKCMKRHLVTHRASPPPLPSSLMTSHGCLSSGCSLPSSQSKPQNLSCKFLFNTARHLVTYGGKDLVRRLASYPAREHL